MTAKEWAVQRKYAKVVAEFAAAAGESVSEVVEQKAAAPARSNMRK